MWTISDNSHERNVSIMAIHGAIGSSLAQADEIEPGIWWVARVKVHNDHQRKGLGRELVRRMTDACANRKAREVRVCPGGYNIPEEQQRAFYAACGFMADDDTGVMIWSP